MKLCEIDGQDKTWAASAGIDLNIDEQCEDAIKILTMLIKIKSKQLTTHWLPSVVLIQQNLKRIVDADLANDASTVKLKDKALKALNSIDALISSL